MHLCENREPRMHIYMDNIYDTYISTHEYMGQHIHTHHVYNTSVFCLIIYIYLNSLIICSTWEIFYIT